MKIAVVGTGYVGLVTGTCLAETGNQVICVDINEKKVKMMKEGKLPIYEPGLELLFTRNINQGDCTLPVILPKRWRNQKLFFWLYLLRRGAMALPI